MIQPGGMTLRFWGVRGSLAAPGPNTARFGGNTVCVELRCGPHLLILDGGSGLRCLGAALAANGDTIDTDILLTHTHLDHVCGLPFFAPMFHRKARIRFWAGHLAPPLGIEQALLLSWQAPLMPSMEGEFRARLSFHDFAPGDQPNLHLGLRIATTALRHPGNAIGYRVEWGGSSVCYITDTEHPAKGVDENLRRFVANADIMIYDATYTEDEYRSRKGWGHSTWQAGVALADSANVGKLVLFHHEPGHDDAVMDAIERAAAERRPGTIAAREGMTMAPGSAAATAPASRSRRSRAAG